MIKLFVCSRLTHLKKVISMAADSAIVNCNIFFLVKQFTCDSWTSLYMYVITITVINLELVSEIEGYTTDTLTTEIWVCRGQYSTLTYDDCQGEYYSTIGCYLWRILLFTSHVRQSATMRQVVLFRQRNVEPSAVVGFTDLKVLHGKLWKWFASWEPRLEVIKDIYKLADTFYCDCTFEKMISAQSETTH